MCGVTVPAHFTQPLGYQRYTSYELVWGEARHRYIPILLAPLAKANDRIRGIRGIREMDTIYQRYPRNYSGYSCMDSKCEVTYSGI